MIPGDDESRACKRINKKESDRYEFFKREAERLKDLSESEKIKTKPFKALLIPTFENTTIPSGERLINMIRSYGFGGDYDDEDYSQSSSERTPNDDRADSMNPNNDSYKASMDNRSVQLNRK